MQLRLENAFMHSTSEKCTHLQLTFDEVIHLHLHTDAQTRKRKGTSNGIEFVAIMAFSVGESCRGLGSGELHRPGQLAAGKCWRQQEICLYFYLRSNGFSCLRFVFPPLLPLPLLFLQHLFQHMFMQHFKL